MPIEREDFAQRQVEEHQSESCTVGCCHCLPLVSCEWVVVTPVYVYVAPVGEGRLDALVDEASDSVFSSLVYDAVEVFLSPDV